MARLSEWLGHRPDGLGLNVSVVPWSERPDLAAWANEKKVYELVDAWSTWNGSWDKVGEKWGIVQWARDAYLKGMGDPLHIAAGGADHHILGCSLDEAGKIQPGAGMLFGSDGLVQLSNNAKWTLQQCGADGWTNVEMYASSSYGPERGESGPWAWFPFGLSDIIVGAGMPLRNHVSFFAVWRAKARPAVVAPPVDPPPVDPPPGSGDYAAVLAALAGVRADVRALAEHLGLKLS